MSELFKFLSLSPLEPRFQMKTGIGPSIDGACSNPHSVASSEISVCQILIKFGGARGTEESTSNCRFLRLVQEHDKLFHV